MNLKSLVRVMIFSLVAVAATAVAADDWWSSNRWTAPKPYYGYSSRYGGNGSSCAHGVCRPSYGTGSYYGRGNAGWSGYRSPAYEPAYRPDRDDRYGDWETSYRGSRSSRSRYSPFYD